MHINRSVWCQVFSFDRLLFTLTFHLEELSAESCRMLLKELEALHFEETRSRSMLYASGVRNIAGEAMLPPEGRAALDIPEGLASYDDQRICTNCQHTCFLSAVCCTCR